MIVLEIGLLYVRIYKVGKKMLNTFFVQNCERKIVIAIKFEGWRVKILVGSFKFGFNYSVFFFPELQLI